MSKKGVWAVAILVLGVILLFVFIPNLLFPTNASNSDQAISTTANKFSLERTPLPSDGAAVSFIPEKIGTYERQELNSLTPDARNEIIGGATDTTSDGQEITLSVWQPSSDIDNVWQTNFLSLVAGDLGGQVDLHRDSRFPFRYGQIISKGFFYYEFKWINNGWVIAVSTGTASTKEINIEAFIEFVNAYPY